MSALPKFDADMYAIKREQIAGARDYMRALTTVPPIKFSIGSGRIRHGLDKHLPVIAGLESSRRYLRDRLTNYLYSYAANEAAQAVDLKLTISSERSELTPPIAVEEGEYFITVDKEGLLRSVFIPPYHALMNANDVAIESGLAIECRVINPGYHHLKDDQDTEPQDGAGNLPVREWRYRDPLADNGEKWPPPSYLAELGNRGQAPHGPPEAREKLPPEVMVTVNPYTANRHSGHELKHEENADFEESREPPELETANMERALAAIAASHATQAETPHSQPAAKSAAPRPTATSAPRGATRVQARAAPPAARPATATKSAAAQPQSRVAATPVAQAKPAAEARQNAPAPRGAPLAPQPAHAGATAASHSPPAAQPVHTAGTPHTQSAETARHESAPHPETPGAEAPAERAELAHVESTAGPATREAPQAEPRPETEAASSLQSTSTAAASREPAEPAHAPETPHVGPTHHIEETPSPESHAELAHAPETPHVGPAHHIEETPSPESHAENAHAPETPHVGPAHHIEETPSPESHAEFEQRTIKLAEKEEMVPHIAVAGSVSAHGLDARQEASHAPAYVHLLEVPTHHHIYDTLQPAQKKTLGLTQTAQLQTKMAAAPSASPSLAPKIVQTPVPVAKSAPKQRLTRSAFLKHLLAPGLMPVPGGDSTEEG